jgi:hypothetical protein
MKIHLELIKTKDKNLMERNQFRRFRIRENM